jgi:hypothetical protein
MLYLVGVGALVSLLGGFAVAQEKKPDAMLKLTDRDVAIGVGFSWGKGTLTYQGKTYPVKVEGLSVGEVGVNQASPAGASIVANGGLCSRQERRASASRPRAATTTRLRPPRAGSSPRSVERSPELSTQLPAEEGKVGSRTILLVEC